ncbi:serine/threonine-protein kinase [Glutamicibacter sp.]|uniref:serine/threonine-protein kinase n=1 Tax=Glutamicibacter sp. TaxID=1931995 RepID=UPI0028BF05C7|nr:serine/threonine-protein kinase [Glutamicibacter sp.]
MSTHRPPAPAPVIEGFSYVKPLGTGGFSDVFLYEQQRPRRKVAVKVLLADMGMKDARERFEAEANLMATLSTHPYIVTIYQAEITDDARSYLAMEYCSRPGLDARYRKSVLSVAEALALGVQLCSAVETAHQAGIIHRDIKPANVLTTDYNRPALTDFGISGVQGADVAGLSVPWSAPEAFTSGHQASVSMDVYSLGATLYTVLAGHSPFVQPGQDNSQATLIQRILDAQLPHLERHDVPEALNQALAVSMAKVPESRFASAAQLAKSLQRIQADLGLSVTPFEILEEVSVEDGEESEGEATRVRRVVSIDDAQLPLGHDPLISRVPGQRAIFDDQAEAVVPEATQPRFRSAPLRDDQQVPDPDAQQRDPVVPVVRKRLPKILILAIAAVCVIVAVAVSVNLLGAPEKEATPNGPLITSGAPADAVVGASVKPVGGFSTADDGDKISFSWKNPEPAKGDFYQWSTVTATKTGDINRTDKTEVSVPKADGETCIEVKVVRANGQVSEPASHCAKS